MCKKANTDKGAARAYEVLIWEGRQSYVASYPMP